MTIEPFDWNVNILGSWNLAIFSPKWVAQNLFDIPEGSPASVELVIDMVSPPRLVNNEGMKVVPGQHSFQVYPAKDTFESLDKAKQVAVKALGRLPVTPVRAAGFNVRYRGDASPTLITAFETEIDKTLSEHGQSILTRGFGRSLKCGDGVLNLNVTCDADNTVTVICNFHRESDDNTALIQWLGFSVNRLREIIREVVGSVLCLTIPEEAE